MRILTLAALASTILIVGPAAAGDPQVDYHH